MPITPYDNLVNKYSTIYRVNPFLIKAVMKRESNFNPMAHRAEPHINDASWGLMQVLLKTARWMLKDTSLTSQQLLKPDTNIKAGVSYLAYQQKRYSDIKDVIAAYNAGSARKKASGEYINQGYVDKVYSTFISYGGSKVAGISDIYVIGVGAIFGLLGYFVMKRY